MQALLDAVRATGAKNVVIAGGLDWSYDLSGFLEGKQLVDRDGQRGDLCQSRVSLQGRHRRALDRQDGERPRKTLPVIVSEFGRPAGRPKERAQWVASVLQALEDHQWDWTAWDLHPAAGPRLISDWKYTPTPHFGKWVKQALLGRCRVRLRRQAASAPATTGPLRSPGRHPAGVIPARPVGIFEDHQDVGDGAPSRLGRPSTEAAGTYTVSGSGENMWAARDAFHYVWKKRRRRPRAGGRRRVRRPGQGAASQGVPDDPPEPRRRLGLCRRRAPRRRPDVAAIPRGQGRTHARGAGERLGAQAAAHREAGANTSDVLWRPRARIRSSPGRPCGSSSAGAVLRRHRRLLAQQGRDRDGGLLERGAGHAASCRGSGRPVLYSTLETQTIASTDRRVVYVTPTRIEAPNWLRDGRALIYNSGGRIYRIPRRGRHARGDRHRLRHAVQQRPRRLARRHAAGDQRPVAGAAASRSSTRCPSPAGRPR